MRTILAGLLMGLLLPALVGRAQQTANVILVDGCGSAKARPTVVEIGATISAEAELADDARVKERDARQRAVDALEAGNLRVVVESVGYSVNPTVDPNVQLRAVQVVVQNGTLIQTPTVPDTARRFAVTEQLKLVLKGADKFDPPNKLLETVLKVIDAARENGLQFGPTTMAASQAQGLGAMPLITYRIADVSDLRQAAYKSAIEDARAKAAKLAELSGAKVGRIVGIQDQDSAGSGAAMTVAMQQNRETPNGISSTVLDDLALNVRLRVQFEMIR